MTNDGYPLWSLLFYCFRCGDSAGTLSVAQSVSASKLIWIAHMLPSIAGAVVSEHCVPQLPARASPSKRLPTESTSERMRILSPGLNSRNVDASRNVEAAERGIQSRYCYEVC